MHTNIPIWEKYNLTREEAAKYFQIGENRLSKWIENNPYNDCLLYVGTKVLIKRKKFEKIIDALNVI